jgi:hypothetical protein
MDMKTNKNDGGPAFPISDVYFPNGEIQFGMAGMSLRDYFAGQALQQFVAERDHNVWAHERSAEARHEIARAAYRIADAMIAARKESE